MFDVTLDMKTRNLFANLLKQMGEVSTSIINLKLTENLINAFPLFHNSVRTSESRFLNHMLKRNPITGKFFLNILSNFHFLAMQSLPLRGDGDGSDSNFTQLYLIQEEDSPILKKRRTKNKKRKQISTLITLFRMKWWRL